VDREREIGLLFGCLMIVLSLCSITEVDENRSDQQQCNHTLQETRKWDQYNHTQSPCNKHNPSYPETMSLAVSVHSPHRSHRSRRPLPLPLPLPEIRSIRSKRDARKRKIDVDVDVDVDLDNEDRNLLICSQSSHNQIEDLGNIHNS